MLWSSRDVVNFILSFHGSQIVKIDMKTLEKKSFVAGFQVSSQKGSQ